MIDDIVLIPMARHHLRDVMVIERRLFSTPWTEAMFRQEVDGAFGSRSIVAVLNTRVVAYRIAWFVEREVHLVNIAVDRPFQKLGIGAHLLADLVSECRQESREFITLEVREGNVQARAFYRRHGFRVVGVRKGYYTDNREDAILMTLDLGEEDSGRSRAS